MNVVQGSGAVIEEPHWRMLLSDDLEIEAAAEHWRAITTEMRARAILSPSNRHAVQRLVLAYVLYDRAAAEVAENGAVSKPKRGNPKAIARISPHFTVMRENANDAASLEAELGLSPRRRSTATKADSKAGGGVVGGGYLKSVSKS